MHDPLEILTEEEFAFAVALALEPVPLGARDRIVGERGSGFGVSMDTLVLMRLAAEDLLRKVEIYSRGFPDSIFDERLEELRDELVNSGRIGRP
jgi:hypothetical protein